MCMYACITRLCLYVYVCLRGRMWRFRSRNGTSLGGGGSAGLGNRGGVGVVTAAGVRAEDGWPRPEPGVMTSSS